MTWQSLFKLTAAELEAMSDKELFAYFEPCLKITRPELAEKPLKKPKNATGEPSKVQGELSFSQRKKAAAEKMRSKFGIDLSDVL